MTGHTPSLQKSRTPTATIALLACDGRGRLALRHVLDRAGRPRGVIAFVQGRALIG